MNQPIYHFAKLNVETNVPLEIIEELFIKRGLDKYSFSVFHVVDKDYNKITVFDYPVGMKEEDCLKFISDVQKELDILSNYYSEAAIRNIVKQL